MGATGTRAPFGRAPVVEYVTSALKRKGTPRVPVPAVLLVGPRGSGGTAVLNRLWADHTNCPGAKVAAVRDETVAGVLGRANADGDPAVPRGRRGFADFKTAVDEAFPGVPISDGNSMMAYDSVLTTVSAIRLATTPASTAHAANHLPPTQAVAGEFSALHGPLAVLGASGPLAFLADYTNNSLASDPNRKAVPIMQLNDDGTSSFKTLEWPVWSPKLPMPY